MRLSAKNKDLALEEIAPTDVTFGNLFEGTERSFDFEDGNSKYEICLKKRNLGLNCKVILDVKIAGFEAEIRMNNLSNLSGINEKFDGIDLMLFDDETKVSLLSCLFENEIASFSLKAGFELQLIGAKFEQAKIDSGSKKYTKEIGINITKDGTSSITFNLMLNDDLLSVLSSKFVKAPIPINKIDEDLPFDWYTEIGRTSLPIDDYKNLEEYDIILLDDDSNIRSGKYQIKGLKGMNLYGRLDGCNLILDSESF